jgi:hypothetical protein
MIVKTEAKVPPEGIALEIHEDGSKSNSKGQRELASPYVME